LANGAKTSNSPLPAAFSTQNLKLQTGVEANGLVHSQRVQIEPDVSGAYLFWGPAGCHFLAHSMDRDFLIPFDHGGKNFPNFLC